MKIGIYWIQNEYGGVDVHLLNLIKFWPTQSDDFVILTNRDNDGFKNIKRNLSNFKHVEIVFVASGWKYLNFFIVKLLHFCLFPFYFIFQIFKIIFEFKKLQLDTLIVQNGGYPGSFKALAAICAAYILKIDKRVLIIHHGSLHNNVLRRPLENYLDFIIPSLSSDIVTVSRATRNTLINHRGWDPSRSIIRVIHNGVDLQKIKIKNNLRKILNISKSQVLVGIVGRVTRYKGHEDLIIAISELTKKERDQLTLVIIGRAPNDFEIKRLITLSKNLKVFKNVVFHGFWDGDIKEAISQLDILAMATKDFEGFGYTIVEAMSCNTPVLCTDVGAVREFINNDLVTIIPPEDPTSIAEYFTSYLNKNSKYLKKAILAEKYVKKFSAHEMALRFYRLITKEKY